MDLQRERERRGWSLEQVAQKTGVPMRYLLVLERGTAELTPPMKEARDKYLKALGLREMVTAQADAAPAPPPPPEPVAPAPAAKTRPTPTVTITQSEDLPIQRLVVVAAFILVAAGLGLWITARIVGGPEKPAVADGSVTPTQPPAAADPEKAPAEKMVRVRANEPTRVTVSAGAEVYHEGLLSPGETVDVSSEQTVVVEVADLTTVSITYNGDRVQPLHNLSHGRRLVFLPDAP